jgi:hypothetical protein
VLCCCVCCVAVCLVLLCELWRVMVLALEVVEGVWVCDLVGVCVLVGWLLGQLLGRNSQAGPRSGV